MIEYHADLEKISAPDLAGFFVGWARRPTPETHLRLLRGSDYFYVATHAGSSRVLGYVTAISDGVLAAYIAHLEVLPDVQDRGIGTELVRRILLRLDDLYMVDLICDDDLRGFYERLGMRPWGGMIKRSYERQAGTCD
jgi:ribosomal protein S18 acetylase RimI-like enzyme